MGLSLLAAPIFGATEAAGRGPPNAQTDPKFFREDAENGAVLCSWMINLEMKAIGEKCHPDDKDIDAALGDALRDIHAFIAANSSTSQAEIEAAARQRIEMAKREAICVGDGENMYQLLHREGAREIRERTAKMLAVPRPPVLNPCL
ncbi:hypothetical protein [Sphingomonas sp. CGMCC 1.13658]|nr:hypothetical protein [Sphingomonas sp. CGMCC 1.13658]MBA2919943.1 hypothetical protein [Sphingomonas sp. CGMCC 1.13658]